jgi:competence protein ComEA
MKRLSALFAATFLLLIAVPFASAADNTQTSHTLAAAHLLEPVNLNTADADTLTQLKGVGLKKAEAIIAWRDANGGFTSIEQLLEVKGIGETIMEANRESLRL